MIFHKVEMIPNRRKEKKTDERLNVSYPAYRSQKDGKDRKEQNSCIRPQKEVRYENRFYRRRQNRRVTWKIF